MRDKTRLVCTMYSLDQLAQAMPIMVQLHTIEFRQHTYVMHVHAHT